MSSTYICIRIFSASCSGSTACSFFDRKEYKTLSCICIISYKSPNKQNAKRKRVHCYLNRRLFFWSVDALFVSERLLKRAKYVLCHFLLSNITLIWRHADAYATLIPFHSSTLFTHIPFPSLTLFTHTPFPITYPFYAFCYIISLNINTEELSRYVAKVVPVSEITDSKLSIFKIGKSECDINNV
jgi:hypothetical protein